MKITLDCGNWYINGYVINGDFESGYNVLNEESGDVVYNNDFFENCLTWIYNS